MYWYYKIPLTILLIAMLLGFGVLGWRGLVRPLLKKGDKPQPPVAVNPPVEKPVATPAPVPKETEPVRPPVQAQDKPSSSVAALIKSAEDAMFADNPRRAREIASSILKSGQCKEYDDEWIKAADIVNEANRIFMNSKAPCPEKRTYVVVSGDNLTRVAYRNNATIGALQRLNGLNTTSDVIRPGDALQYLAGTWSIKVSKSHFLLCLYLDDELYRIYRVSIGRQDRTPAGTFIIKDKEINPAWTPPGLSIPYGDPRNILGTRWMGLKPTGETDQTLRGYGIHGTTEPESIGTAASLGCVRMRNEEVEELYDFIPMAFEKNPITVLIEE